MIVVVFTDTRLGVASEKEPATSTTADEIMYVASYGLDARQGWTSYHHKRAVLPPFTTEQSSANLCVGSPINQSITLFQTFHY